MVKNNSIIGTDYFIGNTLFEYEGIPNVRLEECLKYLKEQKIIALDIETGRRFKKNIYREDTYKPGLDPIMSRIVMLQIGTLEKRFIIDARVVNLEPFREILENPSILKVLHNAKFEGKFFMYHYKMRIVNIWDTMICEKILYNGFRHSYSLAALEYRYLGIQPIQNLNLFNTLEDNDKNFSNKVDKLMEQYFLIGKYLSEEDAIEIVEDELLQNAYVDKSVRLGFIEIGDTPFSLKQIKYGSSDITAPLQIYQEQIKGRVVSEELYLPFTAFKLENKLTQVLAEAEVQGVPFSPSKWLEAYEIAITSLRHRLELLNNFVLDNNHTNFIGSIDLFSAKGTCAIQWTSSKQVIKYFKFLKICPKEKSKHTGKVEFTVGAKTLIRTLDNSTKEAFFYGKDVEKITTLEELKLQYLLFKKAEQLTTTFGEDWLRYVHPISKRVHTNYNQYMISSRLSSSNPNLQQVPNKKDYRDCFTIEELKGEYVLINADYASQEIRVAAEVHNVEKMIKFFVEGDAFFGEDFHSFSATNMQRAMRGSEDYIVQPKELPDGTKNKLFTPIHKKERDNSKALSFKLNYGGSAYTVALDLGIEEEEAEKYIHNFLLGFPGLKESFDLKMKHAVEKGWIQIDSYTDKRYFFPDFEKMEKAYKEAQALKPPNWSKLNVTQKAQLKTYFREKTNWSILWKEYWYLRGKLERRGLNIPKQEWGCKIG